MRWPLENTSECLLNSCSIRVPCSSLPQHKAYELATARDYKYIYVCALTQILVLHHLNQILDEGLIATEMSALV